MAQGQEVYSTKQTYWATAELGYLKLEDEKN
jgi:hypothetical protein